MMNDETVLNLTDLSPLPRGFFDEQSVDDVAQTLIGTILVFNYGGAGPVGGSIVETEAYDERDPASHCYRGPGYEPRKGSKSMFLSGGHAYVYPASYGYCLNFVTGQKDVGSAVLIRALRPLIGMKIMRIRRGPYCRDAIKNKALLCNTPVRLCESLGISAYQDRSLLFDPPFQLYARRSPPQVLSGPRVRVAETIKRHRLTLVGSRLAEEAIKSKRRWVDKSSIDFVEERSRKNFPLSDL